jgi:Predicted exonuclease of the beta-lactamase fold involved in RNA processing
MKVISYGAAKTVTGSAHMLILDDKKILIDCGLFQGVDEQKSEELGFDPKEVDVVLLTHAHIDHCGRIPMLIKNGFKGKIYCTNPTYELSRLMLLDTAKVMLENYKSNMRRFQRGSIKSKQINDIQEGVIIIAGSGMLSGGRILHHIRHHAYKEQNAIVFVGYQPHGTLGRRILEKQNPVFVMGEPINIRAKIYTVNGFSSHADQSELIEWVNAANPEKYA